jgi:uncharacterized membrane protein YgaE (UPF0421/DUF939 family)
MRLEELNERYDEYTLSEEYLNEGLRIFKKSKALRKLAKKMDQQIKATKKGVSTTGITKLSKDVNLLANKFEKIEQDFAGKKLNKKEAKAKIEDVKKTSVKILKDLRSQKNADLFKTMGMFYISSRIARIVSKLLEYKFPDTFGSSVSMVGTPYGVY